MAPAFLSSLFIYVLCALLVLLPFAAKPVLICGGISLTLIAGLAIFRTPRRPEMPCALIACFLSIIAMIFLSAIWSPAPTEALTGVARIGVAFLCAGVLLTATRVLPQPALPMRRLLLLAVVAALLLLIGFHLSGFALQHWWLADIRPATSTMVNKATGALVLMLAPLCVLIAPVTKNFMITPAICLAFAGTATILGESQSSLLALLVLVIAMILPVQSALMWKLLRILLIGGLITAPWLVDTLFEMLAARIHETPWLAAASIPQRFEVWQAFADQIFKHPWLGQGFDAARHIERLSIGEIYQRGVAFTHPHNLALQIWLEYGVAGIMLASILLVLLLRAIEREPDLQVRKLYLAAFLPPFVVAQIGWGMWQMWWIILLILIATLTIYASAGIRNSKTPGQTGRAP
jgi:exopolysaccharide production protein ExoQ